tara:strand:- start:1881 stop:2066 length:186 start_codon:yes stop_codon:yes gene_type:complete
MSLRQVLQQNNISQALIKVRDIKTIINGNRYEKYMINSLNDVEGELSRQLANLKNHGIIDS